VALCSRYTRALNSENVWQAVLVMGKVQPLQLLDKVCCYCVANVLLMCCYCVVNVLPFHKMLSQELPAPEWAYPTWSPRVGASFKIAFISSDLLRNHPVLLMCCYCVATVSPLDSVYL
jgi:hypothetical protein